MDSRDCGIRAHFPGANGGIPITRRRAWAVPLTVDEDYDLIDDTPDLDPVTFNSRRIHITQTALAAWGRHPKVLQARIREALLRGGYWRTLTGEHLLEIGRHQMLLSSDGLRCESYVHLPAPPMEGRSDPIDALLEPGWDREAVTLSPHAVRQFAGRHRVSEDEGANELFDLLDDAAARGKQMRLESGNHSLTVDGFTLTLTPDGTTVVRYRTVHAERMPSEVRNKVKSRFHVRKRNEHLSQEDLMALLAERDCAVTQVPPDRWVPIAQIRELFDPGRARITASVIDRTRTDRYAAVDAVREELRQANRNGRWVDGDEGRHLLEYRGRKWSISPNGRGVLSCNPPWPESGNDASTLQEPL